MAENTRLAVASGRARLVGDRIGQGTPMICLHAGVADRRMYRDQTPALSKRLDVLNYDRRGFGETRTPDEDFSHQGDLEAVMDVSEIERAILLGCSQGGRVAVDFTLAYPKRVVGLILISSAVNSAPAEPVPLDIEPLIEALEQAEAANDQERVNAIEARMWLDGPRSPAGRVGGPTRSLFLEMNRIALEHPPLTKEQEPAEAYSRLHELKVPTLLMHGTLDFPHVVARHGHMAKAIRGADIVVCDDNAHLPSMENPEVVADQVLAFCRRHQLL